MGIGCCFKLALLVVFVFSFTVIAVNLDAIVFLSSFSCLLRFKRDAGNHHSGIYYTGKYMYQVSTDIYLNYLPGNHRF